MKKKAVRTEVKRIRQSDQISKEKAVLQIYFDTDPAKRAKMTDIILNELNQFVDQGPSAENLNKVKEFMLKKYK